MKIRRVAQILIFILLLAPLFLFAVYAFSRSWFYPSPIPTQWNPAAISLLLENSRVGEALRDSLWIGGVVSLVSLALGFPAAHTLGTHIFRGREWVWLLFFLPTVLPPLAIGMGLNVFFLRLGIAGSHLAVLLAHLAPALPYTIFTLTGVFSSYDQNFEHQARSLGASKWRVFFQVRLKLVLPGVLVAGLFAFLVSWSQYLLTLLIGGGRVLTLPMLLFSAVSGGNPATIAALALVFVLPPVLVIAFTARWLDSYGINVQEQY
jgi:putative spermidine/putrescine transport system permease protein